MAADRTHSRDFPDNALRSDDADLAAFRSAPARAEGIALHLEPKAVLALLLLAIACLSMLHVAALVLIFHMGAEQSSGIARILHFGEEMNLPTAYAAATLLLCSTMLSVIAYQAKRSRAPYFGHWAALAIIFLYLSLDEYVALHEGIGGRLRPLVGFSYAWVVPFGIAVALIFVAYIRFLLFLPRRTGLLFLASGAAYVSGALGLELFTVPHYESVGAENVTMAAALFYSSEEVLEMVGVAMFIYALLSYIGENWRSLHIDLSSPRQPS